MATAIEKRQMTQQEMHDRFTAYNSEINAFIFGDWAILDIATREARETEINAKHNYRHGWIIVDSHSFNQQMAFPGREFVNVFD
jgi:hypothetical protein